LDSKDFVKFVRELCKNSVNREKKDKTQKTIKKEKTEIFGSGKIISVKRG
jgi:hypothetical protein